MRHLIIAVALTFIALSPPAAMAQNNWEPFEPKVSFTRFDAPGLSPLPTRAWEQKRGSQQTKKRIYQYQWNTLFGAAAFALINVEQITAELSYFSNAAPLSTIMGWNDLKKRDAEYIDQTDIQVSTNIGQIPTRRFKTDANSCIVFSTGFQGGSQGSPLYGSMSIGDSLLYGYYCAPRGYQITTSDVAVILGRLSIDGVGQGRLTTSSPAPFLIAGPQQLRQPPAAQSVANSAAPPATSSTASRPSNDTTANQRKLDIIVLWEKEADPIKGSLHIDNQLSTMRVDFVGDKTTLHCTGLASRQGSDQGTWAIRCNNGRNANGIFRINGNDNIGEGRDDLGRMVSFRSMGN
ncbi:hypothetical protein [Ferrovibrio sp.]|uniref:hypothetical protein n=1 Tax=Ferrovibrio sp. TaxID=1917215 RepID=UPI003D26A193